MSKRANPDHSIHEPLAERWSPYGYAQREVADTDLRGLLEAARWSASAFNEQPWRYIVARKTDGAEFDRILSCLVDANQTVEATTKGLSVHQMAGILPDRAKELYGIPEGFRAVTALAVGYAADPTTLPDELRERDSSPRNRRSLAQFVFSGQWNDPAPLLGD